MDKVSKYLIILILLLEFRFFFFISNTKGNSTTDKSIIVGIIILSIILLITHILKINRIFNKYILFFIFIYFCEVIISYIKYNQSFIDTIKISNYNLVILLYIVLYYYSKKSDNVEILIDVIIFFTMALDILLITQYEIYQLSNITFLKISTENFRFGSIRIYEAGNFIEFGTILCFTKLLNNKNHKKKFMYIITVILGILEMIYVAKGRMGLLIVLGTMLIIVCYKNFYNIKRFIVTLILILFTLLFAFNSNLFSNIINSFGADEFKNGDTVRILEIEYYLNQVSESPIFGMGYPYYSSEYDDNYALIRGNNDFKFYKDDVGVIGFFNTFGILGLIWYMALLVKIFSILLSLSKNKMLRDNLAPLGISLLILFESFNTIVMDPQRIIMLPILLIIVECYKNKQIIQNNIIKENL